MTDSTSVLTLGLALLTLIAAGWALLRRPRRPKSVAHDDEPTFTPIGDA